MCTYGAVASVRWELPFVLRLPPAAFFCWEPREGVGLIVPEPRVGTLQWKRACSFLSPEEVFPEVGQSQDVRVFPSRHYRQTCGHPETGAEVRTAELSPGPEGGFSEARPYTAAVLFLCLRRKEDYSDRCTIERATSALNNVIWLCSFFTMDPMLRRVEQEKDSYCTVVSTAEVPTDWATGSAKEILQRVNELRFATAVGQGRTHSLGLNAYEDLMSGPVLPADMLKVFSRFVTEEQQPELWHELFLSAIRRLKRREAALAVVDAQSAFEAAVAKILNEALLAKGKPQHEIDAAVAWRGCLDGLQKRLDRLDKLAVTAQKAAGQPVQTFAKCVAEDEWRRDLYRLRNRIVHGGLRQVQFDEAKKAIVSGLKGVYAVQSLTPAFNRRFIWSGAATELPHVEPTAGRLFRIFEY